MTPEPSLTLVVATLGRVEALKRLLTSVAPQLRADDTVVVVAQAALEEITALAQEVDTAANILCVPSERGATRGRNTGVAATARGSFLIFPNDTTWFPDGSIEAIRANAGQDVLVYTVRDDAGPKFSFPERSEPLNYRNVWDVIEPGFGIRRAAFEAIDGFDPLIGTGAPSPWQAGEVADLLYRWQLHSGNAPIQWAPAIEVGGITDSAGLADSERRRKLRAYGRGCGRVMSRYRAPLWFRAAYVVAGLFVAVKRPGLYRLSDGWFAAIGRCEGTTGHLFGGGFDAVTK